MGDYAELEIETFYHWDCRFTWAIQSCLIIIHSIVLISPTVIDDIICDEASLHKHEIGGDLNLGFPSNNTGIHIAVLPWQLFMILIFGIPFYPVISYFGGI